MRLRDSVRGIVILGSMLLLPSSLDAQRITDTSNGTLSAVVNWTVNPSTSLTPISNQVQFRLRSSNAGGYRVEASASHTTNLTAPVDGGSTIGGADIGVGITSITYRNDVIVPRTDTLAAGFGYNPGTVTGSNGLTPYTGMSAGQATIQDIVNNPNLKIMNGPQIATSENATGGGSAQNYMTVTMTLAVLPQYWTPGTFTTVITLNILNGQ